MFIAFLAWIRPTDGNAQLCWKLKKVIKRIIDSVLDAPPANSVEKAPLQQQDDISHGHIGGGGSGTVSSGDFHGSGCSGGFDGDKGGGLEDGTDGALEGLVGVGDGGLGLLPEDLDWLNTVDWTQGEWLDMNLNLGEQTLL